MTITQTDQMNEMSFRSDEQAQSQDRERLQADLQEAWDRVMGDFNPDWTIYERTVIEADIKFLMWYLGVK